MNTYRYRIIRGSQQYIVIVEATNVQQARAQVDIIISGAGTATAPLIDIISGTLDDYIGLESLERIERKQKLIAEQIRRRRRRSNPKKAFTFPRGVAT